MAKDKSTFLIHTQHRNILEKINHEERGKLIINLFDIFEQKEPTYALDGYAECVFDIIVEQMGYDLVKWKEICEKRKNAIKKRWDEYNKSKGKKNQSYSNEYKCMDSNTKHTYTDTDTVSDNTDTKYLYQYNSNSISDTGNDTVTQYCREGSAEALSDTVNGIDSINPRPRFKPPTFEDVEEYKQLYRYPELNTESFLHHYSSNNWYAGEKAKKPIRYWHGVLDTWKKYRYSEYGDNLDKPYLELEDYEEGTY